MKTLLECDADPNAKTGQGATPMRLAKVLGWNQVIALLATKGRDQIGGSEKGGSIELPRRRTLKQQHPALIRTTRE